MSVNSREYWSQRFQTDWDELGGAEQTRFFARIALDAMPQWWIARVRSENLDLCDWGCAEGEGAEVLQQALGIQVTGIDFSPEAIAIAHERHPDVAFLATNVLTESAIPSFDIVFSSNTLEHFYEPWSVFDSIARMARRYIVLLLPYREVERHPEHFSGFAPADMPVVRAGWMLVHAAVIDAAKIADSRWPGDQILAIYSRVEEIESAGIALGSLRLDTPQLESCRSEALASGATIREYADRLAKEQARSSQLEDVRSSLVGISSHLSAVQSSIVEAVSRDIMTMQTEYARLLQSMGDLRLENGSFAAEIDALTKRNEDLVADRARSDDLIGALKAENAAHLAANARVAEQLEESRFQLVRYRDELAQARADSERISGEVAVTMSELEAVRVRNGELEQQAAERIAELNQEVARLSDELSRVYASTSWSLTRPLRVVKRFATRPRETSRYAASRLFPPPTNDDTRTEGRFRRLARSGINLVGRVIRHRSLDPSDKARLVALFRAKRQQAARQLGIPREACDEPPAAQLADVFVWAVIDWHFRTQRPQHLAMALAKKGHRVFYISNNFIDSASPGFVTEDLGCGGRIFQVNLNVRGAPQIYSDMPDPEQAECIRNSLGELLVWTGSVRCMSFVQHPYWLSPARSLPNSQLIYDCMDHHAGFENNAPSILAGEQALIQTSDLLVVTSQWLYDELKDDAKNIALIRNATEFEHFSEKPASVFRDGQGRRVIGYYGAIAEWFDIDLVRKVALAYPDALVVLVGRDTVEAGQALSGLTNVRMVGEVPYADLPYWLYAFDVCLLPFKVIPLTLATNPVKVYEYLSAGKAVVSVDLPEMAQFEDLVFLAGDSEAFTRAVGAALSDPARDVASQDERKRFAARQTWAHRATALDQALGSIAEPLVSVIVLTYNNLDYTKQCLDSLERYSDYPNMEIIVVDNASSDGSQDFIRDWATKGRGRRFIANDVNVGFSAGNNIGLAAASGEYLVIVNNDTYVTPGWVRTLVAHLSRNPGAGLVGPVTNNIGNEAKIEIEYADMEQMVQVAGAYTRKHAGMSFPIPTAAFFCVMLTRAAYETVGGLDERFGVGFFEDDDYCRRLEAVGLGILCAEDVFIHHHLSASFNKLDSGVRQSLFERNKALYESKWGEWQPHRYRGH